ncbi:MAG TPA: hypothetical protein PKE08_00230 [Candidatus Paceibacterota bacterium]|nr:hypothetical protein [Candidatus Paceibacterota bacterium]
MTEKLRALRNRLGILGVGLTVNALLTWVFDYALYPFVIWKLGIVCGSIVMTACSAIVCLGLLAFYNWSKKDWLGIEAVKSLRDKSGTGRFKKISNWAMNSGDPIMMIFLSVNFDPFITVAYMRKGVNNFDKLTARDWKIFFASLIVANVYWSLAMWGGISIAELLIQDYIVPIWTLIIDTILPKIGVIPFIILTLLVVRSIWEIIRTCKKKNKNT